MVVCLSISVSVQISLLFQFGTKIQKSYASVWLPQRLRHFIQIDKLKLFVNLTLLTCMQQIPCLL